MAIFDLTGNFVDQASIVALHVEDAVGVDINGDTFADMDEDDNELPPMTVGPNGEMQPFEEPDDLFMAIHGFWSESVTANQQRARLKRRIMNKALASDINAALPGLFTENHTREEYTETNSAVGFDHVCKHVDDCQLEAIENLNGRFNVLMDEMIPGILADIELLKSQGLEAVVENVNLEHERVKKAMLMDPIMVDGRPIRPLHVFGSMAKQVSQSLTGYADKDFLKVYCDFSRNVTGVEDDYAVNTFASIMCDKTNWTDLQKGWPTVCVDFTPALVMDAWVSGRFDDLLNQTWQYMCSAESALIDYMEKYKTLRDKPEYLSQLYDIVSSHAKPIGLTYHSVKMIKQATCLVKELDMLIPAIESQKEHAAPRSGNEVPNEVVVE